MARVDLKADRSTGSLLVKGAYLEPQITEAAARDGVADELLDALNEMAAWLGLDSITVFDRGDLAPRLAPRLATA